MKNKELLIKDLCARLPYKTKIQLTEYSVTGKKLPSEIKILDYCMLGKVQAYCNGFRKDEIKPYLFPLSNLTEEQRNDISKLLINTQDEFPPYGKINIGGCDNLFISTVKQANALIKYCITHHFDYIGLIPLGLAIDATGLNIY